MALCAARANVFIFSLTCRGATCVIASSRVQVHMLDAVNFGAYVSAPLRIKSAANPPTPPCFCE